VPRDLELGPRILRILALIVYTHADRARFAQSCAVLRAEELDALHPFPDLKEFPFLGRIILIGIQRVFPRE